MDLLDISYVWGDTEKQMILNINSMVFISFFFVPVKYSWHAWSLFGANIAVHLGS